MDFGNKIRIAFDRCLDTYQRAIAYRAMFEMYGQRVYLIELITEEDLQALFNDANDDSVLTMLVCHGWGKTDENAVINFVLSKQVSETEWSEDEFHMTPQNVHQIVKRGQGILLSTACWSGKDSYADVFLRAGFDYYIAPTKTSDIFSAFQFVTAFIGYLLYEVRERKARKIEVPEAVEMARKLDDFWDGANAFKVWEK